MVMISNRPNPNEAFPNPNTQQGTTAWPSRSCPKIGSARGAGRGRRSSIGRKVQRVCQKSGNGSRHTLMKLILFVYLLFGKYTPHFDINNYVT